MSVPENGTGGKTAPKRACAQCEWFDREARSMEDARKHRGFGLCRIPTCHGAFVERHPEDWCHRYTPAGTVTVDAPADAAAVQSPACYRVGLDPAWHLARTNADRVRK